MRKVSTAYKLAMDKLIRDRAYISISVGVVSQEAQASAKASGTFTDFTNDHNIFKLVESYDEYASYEQNYWKADGTQLLKPRDTTQYADTGLVTESISGSIRVSFDNTYSIRGLTIIFGTAYPTTFKIKTSIGQIHTFNNNNSLFETDTPFGDIAWFEIIPVTMVGGQQRLHIHEILCGIGLIFDNTTVESAIRTDEISTISEELPNRTFSVTVFDTNGVFNVEDNNSFINFLEQKQLIKCSIGMTLENGKIEWVQLGYTYLKDWQSKKGKMTFNATDLIAQMDNEYIAGYRKYTRTAYQEAVSILTDMGLEPDEYYIDDYLNNVTLTNPMPEGRHSECLQLLANACRCVFYQDSNRLITLKTHFEKVADPDNIIINTSSEKAWSNKQNIISGADITYVDLSQDFYKVNDTMYLLPDNNQYLNGTGFVSAEISDSNGYFTVNPYIQLTFDELYRYYSFNLNFGGNVPEEIMIRTYKRNVLVDTASFNELNTENLIFYDFQQFDKVVLEIIKAKPNSRIVINKFNFGELTDFTLKKQDMLENPMGYKNQITQSVSVKVFSYTVDSDGKPKEVEDNVWVTKTLNTTGVNVKVENPLIDNTDKATKLAEWIGNYYMNNIYYDVNYRGEPKLEALDIIKMDSDVLSNLNVEINSLKLQYNGAFKGNLSLHKV